MLNTARGPCLDAVQIVFYGLCPHSETEERDTHGLILFT